MKTITIRDLRQRWPEAEAALAVEDEILITRDSKPVARLLPIAAPNTQRRRWNPAAHARWQKKVSGGRLSRSDAALAEGRSDRRLTGRTLMIYLDTSCLLKLLFDEPESEEVRRAVDAENDVVVSSLAELETEVQLKAAALGGGIRASQWRHYQAQLSAMRQFAPFQFRYLPASVFSTALRQQRHAQAAHCRSLDRLHLAAMEELNLKRLMTLDQLQAKAARALKLAVLCPGRKQ